MHMTSNKIFSFFSGAGFLDLGFEARNFEIVFVNENHKPFLDAYKFSREELDRSEPKFGFSEKSIEQFLTCATESKRLSSHVKEARKSGGYIGFIGGPPCPDFSMAGKHKGFEGENGRLTRIYYDLIIKQQPDWFLFENVKGLFSTKKHREFFNDLMTDVRDAGYAVCYEILNSLEFGVPQYRDRVIIFGIKKKLVKSDIKGNGLPSTADNMRYSELKSFKPKKYKKFSMEKILDCKWPATDRFVVDGKIAKPKNIPNELTVEYWLRKNDTDQHPNGYHHFTPTAGNKRFKKIKEGCVTGKSFKRLHRWRYSPTAAYGNNEVHLHPYKARRLSAAEAMAIQSMPKNFTLPDEMPLTSMFKTIGNGVPFLMARGIAKSISYYLSGIEGVTKGTKAVSYKKQRTAQEKGRKR
jgi:DNA (cytosine-5)-methyltransferase 1